MQSFGPNQFYVGADRGFSVDYHTQRADGGGSRFLYIGDIYTGNTIVAWNSAALTDGGAWTNASDRALKADFTAIDAQAVLAKVAQLPIDEWSYKTEGGQRHLGPVAQDFYAAFGLGADDKHITRSTRVAWRSRRSRHSTSNYRSGTGRSRPCVRIWKRSRRR
jgi:hypothetical protein